MQTSSGSGALRVLHLVGSPTSEFHARLSLLYARDCLAATSDETRYDVRLAYVEPGGGWRFPDDLHDGIAAAPSVPVAEAVAVLSGAGIDVVVPQMFCPAGMTHYRALLDVLGLRYVGNRPEAMALTTDKSLARAVVAAAGVLVPQGEVLRPGEVPTLSPPVVVKPVDADNSQGVTLVLEPLAYPAALAAAFAHSDRALVERYVELGREVRCAVVVHDGQPVPLPLEEYAVHPLTHPVRAAADKLADDDTGELYLVAKDPLLAWIVEDDDPVTAAVHEAALACHDAVGARHYSLFDFRIDPAGRPWFLEAGLYCSYAEQSVVAVMARSAGIALPDLFAAGIALAMEEES